MLNENPENFAYELDLLKFVPVKRNPLRTADDPGDQLCCLFFIQAAVSAGLLVKLHSKILYIVSAFICRKTQKNFV